MNVLQMNFIAALKFTSGGHGPVVAPEYFLRKTGADVVGIGEWKLC